MKVGDLVKHKEDGTTALITKVPDEHTEHYMVYYLSGEVAGDHVSEHPLAVQGEFEVISYAKPGREKFVVI